MITRLLTEHIINRAKKMPVISITGPRQSGKTTLARTAFKKYRYVSFEDIEKREQALRDPKGFLERHGPQLIIDEAQYVPEIFSYIQVQVDEQRKNGMYILTGSQNFLLLQRISQTLAGRVSVFNLMPFSMAELNSMRNKKLSSEEIIIKGFYPRLYDQKLLASQWLPDYINTYVERDVRQIINVGDLRTFRNFVMLCAGRTGQTVNLSSLGNELGISFHTVKSWLSILETSYIIFMLPPYHRNFSKRIVKSPKLYFWDTGLACSLLGIKNAEQLHAHYHKGALYENLIIADIQKNCMNAGQQPRLYFWRDNTGNEVDLLIEDGTALKAVEIKSGKTIHYEFFKGLDYFRTVTRNKVSDCFLVYGGNETYKYLNNKIVSWNNTTYIL